MRLNLQTKQDRVSKCSKQRKHHKSTKDKTKGFYPNKNEKHEEEFKTESNTTNGIPRDDMINEDAEELRKWLCDELGFGYKYFKLFIDHGYDNIDIVVELKENDLIEIELQIKYRKNY